MKNKVIYEIYKKFMDQSLEKNKMSLFTKIKIFIPVINLIELIKITLKVKKNFSDAFFNIIKLYLLIFFSIITFRDSLNRIHSDIIQGHPYLFDYIIAIVSLSIPYLLPIFLYSFLRKLYIKDKLGKTLITKEDLELIKKDIDPKKLEDFNQSKSISYNDLIDLDKFLQKN